jgi:penicillin-binding protein 2
VAAGRAEGWGRGLGCARGSGWLVRRGRGWRACGGAAGLCGAVGERVALPKCIQELAIDGISGEVQVNRAPKRRLAVLYVVVAALLIVLGVRVWNVQIASGAAYTAQASADQVRKVIVPAVRGEILDDTGAALVTNRSTMVIAVNMAEVSQQPDGGAAELGRLAGLLHLQAAAMRQKVRICTAGVKQPCWPGSPYQPIPVAEHVSSRVALQVLESQRQFPGVTAQVQPVVNYPEPVGSDAAQVLGYLQPITSQEVKKLGLPVTGFSGVDLVGQAGLEQQYDRQLRGRAGDKRVAVNAAGEVTGTLKQLPARSGDDLVTSINAKIQETAQSELAAAIHRTQSQGNSGATTGAAVVMTTTGRVVAMASYPSYNPKVWSGGISSHEFSALFGTKDSEPILNRATQGQYAPGSTWKVTSAAAAVADGYPLTGQYNCPATVTIDGHKYANDGSPNLGPMSLHQALVVSCDTVFYDLAYQMWQQDNPRANDVHSPRAPVQKMQKMELAWGFGQNTGIDLPAENPGTVPTREWLYYFWKDNAHQGQNWCKYGRENGTYNQQIEYDDCHSANVWTSGQAVIASIGQGYVTVTPLQLARAYVALANGGTVYSPRIGAALLSPNGKRVKKINPPVTGHLPVSKSALAYIRNALAGVVTSGTAAGAFGGFPEGKVCVAGKTGTAQVTGGLATSVFASFAPCQHPKYVVVMMIPKSGYGADVSAPAVRKIWDAIYGLEGHQAALPGGATPALPHINQAGQIVTTGPRPSKHRNRAARKRPGQPVPGQTP